MARQEQEPVERPLTVAEFVAATGLAERTTRSMIADGRLKVIRFRGVRRLGILPDEVKRVLGQHPARRRRQPVTATRP